VKSSFIKILSLMASCFWLTIAGSCSPEKEASPDPQPEEGAYYLALMLSTSQTMTRASEPSEQPEGRLPSLSEMEDKIDNLTLFLIDATGDNALTTTNNLELSGKDLKFEKALYVDFNNPNPDFIIDPKGTDIPSGYDNAILIKLPPNTELKDGQYAMAAVANMGDQTAIKSLYELRKLIVDKIWENATADQKPVARTNFAMSSYDENGGVLSRVYGFATYPGTRYSPFKGSCNLMRLAARIDLGCSEIGADGTIPQYGAITADNEIAYNVTDGTETSGIVYVNAVELVNSMSKPSYALRHSKSATEISDPIDETNWFENLDCGGLLKKEGNNELAYIIDPNFLLKNKEEADSKREDWFGDSRPEKIKADVVGSIDRFNENRNALINQFIMSDADQADKNKGFTKTLTIGYVNENTFYNEKGIDPMKFATGLIFRAKFVPSKVYSAVDENNKPTSLNGKYSKGNSFWRVKATVETKEAITYFDNEEAAKSFATAQNGELIAYPGGIAYYNIWIRHAEEIKGKNDYVLQYGIVRNNVYRILLKIKGSGSPKPFEIPTETSWEVYTKPWNLRVQPEIIM